LLALLIVVTGAPLVLLAAGEAVVRHHAEAAPEPDFSKPPAEAVPAAVALAPGPFPQFIGRPHARTGDVVTFAVDRVELGRVTGSTVAVRGVSVAPWRSYRVVLLPGATSKPRRVAAIEDVGQRMPSSIGAFSVLPAYDQLAIVATPLVLASLVFLAISSRRQSRTEDRGTTIRGLRGRPRRSRRPPSRLVAAE
jgi:hypothetical protein